MRITPTPAVSLLAIHAALTTTHGVAGNILGAELSEDIIPDTDNSLDLGSASKSMALAYIRALIIKNIGAGDDPNIQSNSTTQTMKIGGNIDLLTNFLTGNPGAGDPPEFKSVSEGGLLNEPYMGVVNGGLAIKDGIVTPNMSGAGVALIFVDVADGDLKIRFSDDTVKTIIVDT